jgi:hypothetical protein
MDNVFGIQPLEGIEFPELRHRGIPYGVSDNEYAMLRPQYPTHALHIRVAR